VNLTDELDRFVASKVASGKYENASEVVRAALRALEEQEEQRREWVAFLRREAADGFAELDRGEGIAGTPSEIMSSIRAEVTRMNGR
jgi:antitoxin ParD1/3/4